VARFRHVPPSEHATVHPRARRGRPASLSGAVGRAVSVEVHVSNGLRGFTIVDRPDAAVREARDRVRAAILSSGPSWPLRRVTVNLAPAAVAFGNHGVTRKMGRR